MPLFTLVSISSFVSYILLLSISDSTQSILGVHAAAAACLCNEDSMCARASAASACASACRRAACADKIMRVTARAGDGAASLVLHDASGKASPMQKKGLVEWAAATGGVASQVKVKSEK